MFLKSKVVFITQISWISLFSKLFSSVYLVEYHYKIEDPIWDKRVSLTIQKDREVEGMLYEVGKLQRPSTENFSYLFD